LPLGEEAPSEPGPFGGPGEVARRLRARDWATSPLGPPEGWTEALRAATRTLLRLRRPAALVWGTEPAFLCNQACATALGEAWQPDWLGAPAALAWGAAWDATAPRLARALADAEEPVALGPLAFAASALEDEAGPGGVLLLAEPPPRAAPVEALAALREAEARARTLFDAAPFAVILIDPATHQILDVNERACHDYGWSREEFLRMTIGEVDALADPSAIRARGKAHVVAPGVQEFEARHRTRSGEIRDVLVRVQGVRLGGRDVTFGAHMDITDRKTAEARQVLMARELDHRAKNLLAVVQAALRLTQSDDLDAFRRAVEGRIGALARAHSLLAEARWAGAELRSLVEGELAPFLADQRAELRGGSVIVPPQVAQPLAMAVHELGTNAVKHGALSVPDGRVAIAWRVAADAAAPRLALDWVESGGPQVAAAPARRGFGTRMLEATVRGQLGGRVALDWAPGGLACRIELPLRGGE
jgi:PAS domain S-box-containing protein